MLRGHGVARRARELVLRAGCIFVCKEVLYGVYPRLLDIHIPRVALRPRRAHKPHKRQRQCKKQMYLHMLTSRMYEHIMYICLGEYVSGLGPRCRL